MSGTVAVLAVGDGEPTAERVGRLLGNAGFRVHGPDVVAAEDVVTAVRAANASAVVVVGDGGLAGRTPGRVSAALTRRIPGWAPVVYAAAWSAMGPRAAGEQTVAGYVDGCPVVALPGDATFALVATEQVLAAELGRWIGAGLDLVADDDAPPPPTSAAGGFGNLGAGGNAISLTATPEADAAPPTPDEGDDDAPLVGWKRAVAALNGTVHFDRREELPQPVEKLAPLHDVLHTAGEVAVLALPNKVTFSLWGWPDLRRPNSKVVAIGWGEPLCEALALHRFPVQTGTCIQEARGVLPTRSDDVATVCKAVTGRAPADTSGELFAVDGESVWIQRRNRVIKWDGSRERDDGNPKQVLSSLVLRWSNR